MPVRIDQTNEVYHLDPALSASGAKTIAMQSPAHFKYAKRKVTTAFDLGTAVHTLVLEPHLSSTVWCGPETRRGSAWKDQYAAAAEEGAILLTEGDYQIAVDMANSVRSNAAAMELQKTLRILKSAHKCCTPRARPAGPRACFGRERRRRLQQQGIGRTPTP